VRQIEPGCQLFGRARRVAWAPVAERHGKPDRPGCRLDAQPLGRRLLTGGAGLEPALEWVSQESVRCVGSSRRRLTKALKLPAEPALSLDRCHAAHRAQGVQRILEAAQ
jgi:hypothetical protein